MKIFKLPSPVEELKSDFLSNKRVQLWIKRDDLIHTEVSGNKWRKLKYNIEEARNKNYKRILTFGGAYSNHIAATAVVGKLFNVETIGVIRGDEGFENKTLLKAREDGMKLHFVSRSAYRQKNEPDFIECLKEKFGKFYLVPEGGANDLGVKGCEEILRETEANYDFIAVAAGTGTTASGIYKSMKAGMLMVFPALKGGEFLLEEIKKHESAIEIDLQANYHFGGYGKTKPDQLAFMQEFQSQYSIELDKIYTSKLFFGLFDLIKKNYFSQGSKILVIHTGGLQGN